MPAVFAVGLSPSRGPKRRESRSVQYWDLASQDCGPQRPIHRLFFGWREVVHHGIHSTFFILFAKEGLVAKLAVISDNAVTLSLVINGPTRRFPVTLHEIFIQNRWRKWVSMVMCGLVDTFKINLRCLISKYRRAVFHILGFAKVQHSAKGCQGFREMKMRNGGRVLLAVLNFYVWIKICVATFDIIIPSLTAHRHLLLQSRSLPILQSKQLADIAIERVDEWSETKRFSISLSLAVKFHKCRM